MSPFSLSFHDVAPFAYGPSSAWPSDGISTPRPLSCRGREERPASGRTSCRHLLVGDPSANYSRNKRVQPGQGVFFDISLVKPKGELGHVPAKVLGGHLMVDAVDTAFHDSPNRFDAVRAHRTTGVFPGRMIDRFVLVEQPVEIVEDYVVIGVKGIIYLTTVRE